MFSSLYWSCSTGWSPELCALLEKNAKLLSPAHLSRARDYYLYLAPHKLAPHKELDSPKGAKIPKRICDLYLNGGQALLGHRPAGVSSRLKNVMSRGLYGAFPSERAGRRLRLLLEKLFPNLQDFRLYQSIYALSGVLPPVADFLRDRQSILLRGGQIQLWHPMASEQQKVDYLILVLPLSSLPLLVLKMSDEEESSAGLPPSDICSLLQLEALVQALVQTEKLLSPSDDLHKNYCSLKDLRHVFSKPRQGTQYWIEDGIYLYWNAASLGLQTYAHLWQVFLEAGFLLPPNPLAPLILAPALLRNSEGSSSSALSSEGKRLCELLELTDLV